jgi:hypothetical protein
MHSLFQADILCLISLQYRLPSAAFMGVALGDVDLPIYSLLEETVGSTITVPLRRLHVTNSRFSIPCPSQVCLL